VSGAEIEEAREYRIEMEIVVDAYGEEERAMGWYCHLQDNLTFPFPARCIAERMISPSKWAKRSKYSKWLRSRNVSARYSW
jgi:hypothetical protein